MGQNTSLCTGSSAGDRPHLSYNKWTKNEIKLLQRMFRQMAKRSPETESMSKETFLSVYQLPGFLSERLFKVFDEKKSGDIDFGEFIQGLEKFFRSSVQDKADVIFKMYDLNDNGCVDDKELSTMLHSLIRAPPKNLTRKNSGEVQLELSASEYHRSFIHEKVETAFKECDLNHDGKLSLHQFNLFLTRNQDIVQMMEETFSEHAFLGNLNPIPPATIFRSRSEPLSPRAVVRRQTISYPENEHEKEVLKKSKSLYDLKGLPPDKIHSAELITGENLGFHNVMCPSSAQSSRASDYEYEESTSGSKLKARKGTCFCCKIIFVFQQGPDENLVSLGTDPDYSVFNVSNQSGITTSIDVRSCLQCGGNLMTNIDQHTDEGESCAASQIELPILRQKGDQFQRLTSPTRESECWNPNRIIMQGILSKRGRTTKTWKDRWYVLKDKFLYHYKIAKHREGTSGEPMSVEFIRDCTCEIDESESEKQSDKFCFRVTFPEGKIRKLWTKAYQEREHWVESLRLAAETGKVMDFYEIHHMIGRGKFSKVHSCTERKTNKKWAVKIIKKDSLSADDKNLLRTEISILRIVNHPYIVSLHDVFESSTNVYLIMTLIEGGDLFDALQAKRFQVREKDARTIVFKVIEALIYIHDFGIVHRDLKTENILVKDKANPLDIMLSDFGLSKFSGPQEIMLKKVGTVAYVAPEVLLGNGYTHKVDIWSLGCIMHLLLRGYLPFDAKSEEKIRERILTYEVTFNRPLWKVISPEAKDLLKRLLKKKPAERIDLEDVKNHAWFKDLDLLHQQRTRMASITNSRPASSRKSSTKHSNNSEERKSHSRVTFE